MTAEKKQEGKMDMQAAMEVYKKLATPGAPHKLLARMAGSWTTRTKSWMDPTALPWNPQAPPSRRCSWAGASFSRSLPAI